MRWQRWLRRPTGCPLDRWVLSRVAVLAFGDGKARVSAFDKFCWLGQGNRHRIRFEKGEHLAGRSIVWGARGDVNDPKTSVGLEWD